MGMISPRCHRTAADVHEHSIEGNDMLAQLASLLVWAIPLLGLLCLAYWWFRLIPACRDTRNRLVKHLEKQLGGFNRFKDLTRSDDPSERIDGFLATIQEVVEHPASDTELRDLDARLEIRGEDATTTRLPSWFERAHNMLRYAIEGFPLLGILGTILPLGLAINSVDTAAGATDISAAVGNFGAAIWTTVWGLICAIVLGVFNAYWEPSFDKLVEQCHRLDGLVLESRKKLRLHLSADTPA